MMKTVFLAAVAAAFLSVGPATAMAQQAPQAAQKTVNVSQTAVVLVANGDEIMFIALGDGTIAASVNGGDLMIGRDLRKLLDDHGLIVTIQTEQMHVTSRPGISVVLLQPVQAATPAQVEQVTAKMAAMAQTAPAAPAATGSSAPAPATTEAAAPVVQLSLPANVAVGGASATQSANQATTGSITGNLSVSK